MPKEHRSLNKQFNSAHMLLLTILFINCNFSNAFRLNFSLCNADTLYHHGSVTVTWWLQCETVKVWCSLLSLFHWIQWFEKPKSSNNVLCKLNTSTAQLLQRVHIIKYNDLIVMVLTSLLLLLKIPHWFQQAKSFSTAWEQATHMINGTITEIDYLHVYKGQKSMYLS